MSEKIVSTWEGYSSLISKSDFDKEKFTLVVEYIRALTDYNSGFPDGTGEGLEGLKKVGNWVTGSEQDGGDSLGDNGQLREP